jgi:hypothetical protein
MDDLALQYRKLQLRIKFLQACTPVDTKTVKTMQTDCDQLWEEMTDEQRGQAAVNMQDLIDRTR